MAEVVAPAALKSAVHAPAAHAQPPAPAAPAPVTAVRLGAIPRQNGRTCFTLWAPRHARVGLRLQGSARAIPMEPAAGGYHSLTTDAPVGTAYHFEFADGRLRPDPASRWQPQGVHGASVVTAMRGATVPAAATVAPTSPASASAAGRVAPLAEHVLYELHVGTFTPEGTFDAIIPRLAELKALGVTAVELMPIAQFPGERNWGYDGVYPFAAQESYGGPAGLRRLTDACHAQGLVLLLDVVYNHLGPEGNYLAEFGPYFTDRYRTPWGDALNFDGPHSDAVREYFIQSALHWTDECGVDGLRLDAVHAIHDCTARPFLRELADRLYAAASLAGRRLLVIAESGDNDPQLVRAQAAGGLGLDGCWNDDYHHAIRTALTGDRRGYYAPFGAVEQIAKAVDDRFVFAGEFSNSHGRRHGAPARDVGHGALVVYAQNHDQIGNRPDGARLDQCAGVDGARLAAGLVLMGPFTPMLWMGEEYAEPAPFQYFVSHSDAALIAAVRRGRALEFAEFHVATPVPDPQDTATFERSRLHWELRSQPPHAATLNYYQQLIHLRRLFQIPQRASTVRAHAVGEVITLEYGPEPRVWVVANFGRGAAPLPECIPSTERVMLLESNSRGEDATVAPATAATAACEAIGPRRIIVLRTGKVQP